MVTRDISDPGDEPPAQTKMEFLELASNQTFTLHKNLDTKLFRMPHALHSSIPFSLFLCRLEMCHPFSQILPYL